MRPWIECIFNNASAHADFLTYIAEIEHERKAQMHKAVLENRLDDAKSLAFELKFYQDIGKMFKKETKEHRDAVQHLERRKR